jgi:hypothetical protein
MRKKVKKIKNKRKELLERSGRLKYEMGKKKDANK